MNKTVIIVIAVISVLIIAGIIVFFVHKNRGTGGGGTGGGGTGGGGTGGGGTGGGGTGGGRTYEVKIQDGPSFNPSLLTISKGDTVKWINIDDTSSSGHSVVSDSGAWSQSPRLSLNNTFEHQFKTAGDFPYHCGIHLGMTGTIKVEN